MTVQMYIVFQCGSLQGCMCVPTLWKLAELESSLGIPIRIWAQVIKYFQFSYLLKWM